MSHYYQILFSILFTNIILIQSTVILAQSGTKTQIISPSFKRAQLATGRDYLYKPLTNAPNAKWIWYGMVDDCGCAKNNITIQHFFKLKCLTSKIYIQVNGVNYQYVYINGKKLPSHFGFVDSQIDTSNNTCGKSFIYLDDIFNLTIQVQLFGYFKDCCGVTPGSLIYTVYTDDCNDRLCQCNNLVQETCSSQNCTGPINYITDQRGHIFKPNPLIQELSCSVCGNGFFLNLETGYCNFCSDNCLTCNSRSYCLSCNISNGLYLNITSNTCNSISSYSLAVEGKNDLSPGIVAGISVVFIVFIIMIIVAIYLYLHKKKSEAMLVQKQIKDTDSNKIVQSESNSHNCSFCIEDNCNLITSCQHQFHVQCLKQWIRKNKKCPTCHNENIEMIKIMMCKKCKIYQHFDITSSRFNFNYNSSINSVKNHECIMKIEKINTN